MMEFASMLILHYNKIGRNNEIFPAAISVPAIL